MHNRYNLTDSYVLLSTCMVKVYDPFDIAHDARVILDFGSQFCFIIEKFCKRLKLPLLKANICVTGLYDSVSSLNKKCLVKVRSQINDFSAIECIVVPKVTGHLPELTFDITTFPHVIIVIKFTYKSQTKILKVTCLYLKLKIVSLQSRDYFKHIFSLCKKISNTLTGWWMSTIQ